MLLLAVCAARVCADPCPIVTKVLRWLFGRVPDHGQAAGHHAIDSGTVLAAVNAAPRVRAHARVCESGVDRGCAQCASRAFA